MLKTVKNSVKRRKKGFTLIELIIVLAIMAILAAIAIPGFNSIRESSRVKADTQSAATIERAVMVLVADGTVSSSGTIKVYQASDIRYTNTTDFGGADSTQRDAIEGALSEVKVPNQGSAYYYNIVITGSDVDVTCINS